MPTSRRIFHQLQGALVLLTKVGLAVSTRPVVFAYGNPGLTRITWAPMDELLDLVNPFQMPLASIPQYVGFLKSGAYNGVLQDGSLIQASYDVRDNEVVGHRLCYHPCPFDLADWDVASAGDVLDAVEALADSVGHGDDDLLTVRLRGPVRFDFDTTRRWPLHENSHLHLSSPDCRLPVFGPLSVGQFFRFLIRTYYPEVWIQEEAARSLSMDHLGQHLPDESRSDIFMECREHL